jgi:hypothetical protein
VIPINRAFYILSLSLFLLAVGSGVYVVLKEFNRMVCPSSPVRVFDLEAAGEQVYRVEFLQEEVDFKLPVDLTRAGELVSRIQRDLVAGGYPELVAETRKVVTVWCSTLREAGNRFISDLMSSAAAAAGSLQVRLQTWKAGERYE